MGSAKILKLEGAKRGKSQSTVGQYFYHGQVSTIIFSCVQQKDVTESRAEPLIRG